tara:strand:+ start:3768 stop:4283 length:516 start_codon:yes stop_codon:yes gene_type:complete
MKIVLLLIQIILISCTSQPSEEDLLNKSNPDGNYGKEITLTTKQTIHELVSNENQYLNKDILISGEILEVCPMRGCWIKINDKSSDYNLRVKVTDGEIVFPLSSKGKYADIQGKFTKLEFSEEQARKWKMHLAEEKGIELNPNDIIIDTSDLFEYRVIGHGTKIYTFGCNE